MTDDQGRTRMQFKREDVSEVVERRKKNQLKLPISTISPFASILGLINYFG